MRKSAEEKELERIKEQYNRSIEKERKKRLQEDQFRRKVGRIVMFSFFGLVVLIVGSLLIFSNYFRDAADNWEYKTYLRKEIVVVKEISRVNSASRPVEEWDSYRRKYGVDVNTRIDLRLLNILDSNFLTGTLSGSENFAIGDTVYAELEFKYRRIPGSDDPYELNGLVFISTKQLNEVIKKPKITYVDMLDYLSKHPNKFPDILVK